MKLLTVITTMLVWIGLWCDLCEPLIEIEKLDILLWECGMMISRLLIITLGLKPSLSNPWLQTLGLKLLV